MRYAALLRGINVGGNKKVPMSDLRQLLSDLGYADASTYLQSGNAVFSSPGEEPPALASTITRGIEERFGLAVTVVIRTGAELSAVLQRSPVPDGPENPSRFFVAFLAAEPAPDRVAGIVAEPLGQDRIWVSGTEAFLWCPNGAAETVLTNSFIEKRLGVAATSRNWNTVNRLVALTAG
jgi:uncharacterized protein (DUF1697 family)